MRGLRNLVLVVCLLAGASAVYLTLRDGRYGSDYAMYCGSIAMVQAGQDPYLTRNTRRFLDTDWVLPYPAGALVLLSPPCVKPRVLYPALYSLVLILAAVSAWRLWPEDPLLLAALLGGGLAAAPFNYLTGNTGILE